VDAPLERAAILAFFALVGAVVGFALGRRRPADGLVVVGDAKGKHPGLAAAGRKGIAVSGMNNDRFRCGTCDMETTAGPLSRHQRATGHEGRFKV
jgi:hypothetical protein